MRYVAERSDCDNFAAVFAGLAATRYGVNTAGLVLDSAGKHAYNLIVGGRPGELEARAFEPQSDMFVEMGTKPYNAESGYVFFF